MIAYLVVFVKDFFSTRNDRKKRQPKYEKTDPPRSGAAGPKHHLDIMCSEILYLVLIAVDHLENIVRLDLGQLDRLGALPPTQPPNLRALV